MGKKKDVRKKENGLEAAVQLPSGCMPASRELEPSEQSIEDYSQCVGEYQAGHYCTTRLSCVSDVCRTNSTAKHLTVGGKKPHKIGKNGIVKIMAKIWGLIEF